MMGRDGSGQVEEPSSDELRALQAEVAALRERNAALEALFEATDDAAFIKDRLGRYRLINAAAARMLGRPAEEIIGKDDAAIFADESARWIAGCDRGVLAEGTGGTLDEVVSAAGITRTYRTIKMPYRDAGGSIAGVAGLARDVTEPRRAEEELREHREFLARLLDHSPAPIYITGCDGRLLLANPACAEALSRSRHEVVGRPLAEFCDPETAGALHERNRRVAEAGAPIIFEEEVEVRDGRRHFYTVKFPLRDADGRVAAVGGISLDITERKRAEEELARDALLLASVRDSVIVTDLDGIVTYWNEGATRLFGWTAAEMLGRHYADRFPEPARTFVAEEIRRRGAGAEWSGEYEDYRKDGSRFWIDARVGPVLDADGRVVCILGLAYDITDRKRAEAAQRESEEQVRLLLDSAGEAIFGVDTEGRCTFCNAACLRLLGYSAPGDLLGRDMHGLIHHTRPDGAPLLREECPLYRAHRQGEGTHTEDAVLWRGDGTAFPAECWSYPVRRGGEVVGAVVTFVDITERRRVEEELRALNAALENAVEGIARLDVQGRYVSVNRAYAAMLGRRPEDLVGQGWQGTVHPGHRGTVAAAYRRMLVEERAEAEALGVRGDGTTLWMHVVLVKIHNRRQEWTGHYGFMKDISDRKRAEAALRVSADRLQVLSRRVVDVQEEERRHLARELHDEIGQSLTAIAVNLHAVKRVCGPEGLPRVEDCLAVVQAGIQQVRSLALELRPSMLDDLGLVAALRWYADAQARRVGYDAWFAAYPAELDLSPSAAIIAFRVAQEALTNIARHARARRVRVWLRVRAGVLYLVIRDDGVGFDPEATLRRGTEGHGMGLLGMRERAALLGGRVDFRSVPGRRTEVRLVLPLDRDARGGAGA